MIYIVAANLKQARHWANQHRVPKGGWKEIVRLDDTERLRGLTDPSIVYIDGWLYNPVGDKIEQCIRRISNG